MGDTGSGGRTAYRPNTTTDLTVVLYQDTIEITRVGDEIEIMVSSFIIWR